jgi:hypothetical protein
VYIIYIYIYYIHIVIIAKTIQSWSPAMSCLTLPCALLRIHRVRLRTPSAPEDLRCKKRIKAPGGASWQCQETGETAPEPIADTVSVSVSHGFPFPFRFFVDFHNLHEFTWYALFQNLHVFFVSKLLSLFRLWHLCRNPRTPRSSSLTETPLNTMSNKSIPLNISTILIIEKTKKFGTLYGRTSLSDESVGLFLHELEMLKVHLWQVRWKRIGFQGLYCSAVTADRDSLFLDYLAFLDARAFQLSKGETVKPRNRLFFFGQDVTASNDDLFAGIPCVATVPASFSSSQTLLTLFF